VSRHPTSPRARARRRAIESGNRARIERAAPGVFKAGRPDPARESWDTSSEWLDTIRRMIREAEAVVD